MRYFEAKCGSDVGFLGDTSGPPRSTELKIRWETELVMLASIMGFACRSSSPSLLGMVYRNTPWMGLSVRVNCRS